MSRSVNELATLRDTHSVHNWDGYDAMPIDPASYGWASFFLQRFPLDLPLPELSVDPDGEVSFEWSASPTQVLSVSVSPRGRLSYAGLFGEETIQNAEFFRGEIPAQIIEGIHRVGLED